jgi:outer membrane murein-binding lipoprotein Lpp
MAMSQQDPNVTINQRSLSFVLGLVTLLGIMYSGVSTVNGYSARINSLETRNVELVSQVNTLTKKIDDLNVKITELTIALNRVDDRTKK